MSQHHEAAFFPSLESMDYAEDVSKLLASIKVDEVVRFVKQYLQHPQNFIVKTEEF